MAAPLRRLLRQLLPWTPGLLAGGIALVLAIAYSGIFNIAASAGHPAWLEWLLMLGKERSVIVNSKPVDVPELNFAELVPLGAAHFQGGCATCHRMPGQLLNPVYDQMLPLPPDLTIHAPMWTREQLFWMVRNGIQFTGMPAWSGHDRDDEVWAVVAFLEALPSMKPEDYLNYANGNASDKSIAKKYSAKQLASEGSPKINPSACNRCHDTGNAPPTSPYVPRLGGQDSAYIKRALQEYHNNLRQSGFMELIAVELNDEQINNLADYYASLDVPAKQSAHSPSSAGLDLGRQLAEYGDLTRKIPACLSCHGGNKRPDYPHLTGQPEQYLRQQLQVLQRGIRTKTPHGAIMTVIAKRLTEQQIEAASAFFASQSSTGYKAREGLKQ
jgi:cytochrome c553